MVKVFAAHQRKGENGEFVSLELHGDLEMVQSLNTGRFYATTRKAFVSSTFDLETAQQFVGKQLNGTIIRVESDPYEYRIPNSDEVITLAHSWMYVPDEGAIPAPQMVEA